MKATERLYAKAQRAIGEGQLGHAREILDRLLKRAPRHAAGWNLLGSLHQRQDDLPAAMRCFERACSIDPAEASFHNNLGVALRVTGRAADAAECFREALRLDPGYAVAHNNLGLAQLALAGTGGDSAADIEAATASFRRAIELWPQYAKAHHNLGNALRQQGQLDDAVRSLREAVRLEPFYAAALNSLGVALREGEQLEEARGCFERALQFRPDYAKAVLNLGNVLADEMRFEEALQSFRRALSLSHRYGKALLGQGAVLERMGRHESAAACYAEAIQLEPGSAAAHFNLGNALNSRRQLDAAVASYDRALSLDPRLATARANRLGARHEVCDWSGHSEDVEILRRTTQEALAVRRDTPVTASTAHRLLVLSAAEQLAIARSAARRLEVQVAPLKGALELRHEARQRDRLRLGYLSRDFRNHAVGHLTRGLFAQHDRAGFEVFAYSYGPDDGSRYRRDVAASSDHFVDLAARPTAECARRIYDDGIDVLIDLVGWTGEGRFEIPALRPAPVQVHCLGFPGTTGAAFIDYFVGDPVVTPAEGQAHFQEALVLMPHSFQVNDDQQEIDEGAVTRAACGLPPRGFVFCAFNNSYKIQPQIYDVWMRILARVPDSVLWFSVRSARTRENLTREAAARGVAPDRLVFAGYAEEKSEHLARLRLAGLFLDTPYYNAHTTARDALWAGLPVLTCPGSVFASRVAASLLTAVGLPELIVTEDDLTAYEGRAVHLATRPGELAALREQLGRNRKDAPLFDTRGTVRDLERAYREMWRIHSAGEPPRTIALGEAQSA